MWHSRKRDLPALNEQVIGLDDDGDVLIWTRTTDGWYASDKRSNVGHRDVRGPALWTHIPKTK